MSKKKIIILSTIVIILLIGIKGKNLLQERQEEIANSALPKKESIAVTLFTPQQGLLQDSISYLAQVEAQKSIILSTKSIGYIQSIKVSEAQKVKKGDLLANIDDTELLSSIESLKMTLNLQQEDLTVNNSIHQRNKKLYEVGGLAKEQFDLSAVGLQNKKILVSNTIEKIKQLEHQLTYLHIKAPFDGEIGKVIAHEGDLASSGKPILAMNTLNKKLLFSYPPENSFIRIGEKVLINDEVKGEIKTIYTTALNGLAQAEVELSTNISHPLGSTLNIKVLTDEAKGCILPKNTILHQKDGDYVMVYKDERFTPYRIDAILRNDQNVLIESCQNISQIAQGTESKLRELPIIGKVHIVGKSDE